MAGTGHAVARRPRYVVAWSVYPLVSPPGRPMLGRLAQWPRQTSGKAPSDSGIGVGNPTRVPGRLTQRSPFHPDPELGMPGNRAPRKGVVEPSAGMRHPARTVLNCLGLMPRRLYLPIICTDVHILG